MSDLAHLNRAALGGQEDYRAIHVAAVAYTLVIGWFSVAAWWDVGEPFRAATCGGAQVLAIVCAMLARRAATGQMPGSALAGMVFAAGCAWWAAQGVQHAWESNGAVASPVMVFFLAALEPGLFLLAEHVKEGRQALRAAHMKDEAEQAAELARVRAREGAQGGWPPKLVPTAARAAVAVGAALTPAMAHAQDGRVIISQDVGYPTQRAHVEALRASGIVSRAEIVRRTKAPGTNVSRWCRAWEQRNGVSQETQAA